MQSERTAAVLLLDLPPASLAGIDLLSFTTSPRFRGIKDIQTGFHFIFTGATNAFSIRHGLWFFAKGGKRDPSLFISRWQNDAEALVAERDAAEKLRWRANLGEFWREGLAPYRQSAAADASDEEGLHNDGWPQLTSCLTADLLSRILKGDANHWALTSASTAARDRDEIPGIKQDDFDAQGIEELMLLPIDLKMTWPEGATGRERTDAAKDRSWAVNHIISTYTTTNNASIITGELQFCFLMTLILNNWSCFEQWKRILTLVLTCKEAVYQRSDFFVQFIAALRLQLRHMKDAEGGLIDMADEGGSLLKSLLARFRKGISDGRSLDTQDVIDELDDLEAFLHEEYGWQFGGSFAKSGILELGDGEQVRMDTTDFDEDDETGEYAPQVVDLSPEQASLLYPGESLDLVTKLKHSGLVDDQSSSTLHRDVADSASSEEGDGSVSDEEEMNDDLEDLDQRY